MEAAARVDRDHKKDEEEDLDFFQKSVNVHDRFGSNYDEQDEFFSDDEPDEPDDRISCQKGGYLKPIGSFSRSILSSEAKLGTISMLDNVRSSCSTSGRNLSLEMLNLESDEAGMGDVGGVLLSSGPPFGDPLSEVNILDSALSLLDDKVCQKFREKGLFDGLVDKDAVSIENETKGEENDVSYVGAKLNLVTSCGRQTPEPYHSICYSPENLDKPVHELIPEDVSKPSVKSEPSCPPLSCQLQKPRQSKSANSSRKQLNDSNSLDSKGGAGREFPPNNLSLDDLVRYINGESLEKVCSKKINAPTLPNTNTNTKKLKKQPVRKSNVSTTPKARIPLPAAGRLPKTTKKPSHVGVKTEDVTEDNNSPQTVCCEAFIKTTSSTTGMTASAKEAISAGDAEHEDDVGAQKEFVAVLHKKRIKTRKEPCPNPDAHSTSVAPPRTKFSGFQPEKSSAWSEKDSGACSASVVSVSSKSYRSDISSGSIASKRGSLSSLDDSPPVTNEASSLGTFSGNQGQTGVPYSRPSFSKFSTGNSYASVLLQNLPKLSVTGSHEVAQTEPKDEIGAVEITTFSSPLNSEAENEMFLSPPQSEADTGFSSSSSLSPDEAHTSLTGDPALMTSKRNEVVDSDPRSRTLDESSTLKYPTDDAGIANLEQPVEEESTAQDSVSSYISDLDFPLIRFSKLSERTDEVQQNAGETSLAWGRRNVSCVTTDSKQSPVFFDTRICIVAHTKSDSDIVFVFDPDDVVTDTMSTVGGYVPVDDIDGITFTGCSDSIPFETLETANDQYAALGVEVSLGTKTSVEAGRVELPGEPELQQQQPDRWVVSGCASCRDDTSTPDTESKNPASDKTLVESSISEAVRLTPNSGFDLHAAQKFLNRAFKNVLKLERECPDQVVRL